MSKLTENALNYMEFRLDEITKEIDLNQISLSQADDEISKIIEVLTDSLDNKPKVIPSLRLLKGGKK